MGSLVTNTILLLVFAFIVLAAAIAVIMSLERVLGRPIPKLPDSLPVRRNRAFAIVLASMAAGFALVLPGMLAVSICDHCEQHYAWQSLAAIAAFSTLALAISSAIGWIVFAVLWGISESWQLVRLAARP